MDITSTQSALKSIGQSEVLRFASTLSAKQGDRLLGQIAALDLPMIGRLVDEYVRHKPPIELPRDIKPAPFFPRVPDDAQKEHYAKAAARGRALLTEGKVGAFLVAGGQGTRLGYDGPKGEFPVTPIQQKPLFQVFAEQLLAWSRDARKPIPWYIMTSDVNDAATRDFFAKHSNFGYAKENLFIFPQNMMPAFDIASGAMLLAEKESLALSPDGHGGSLRALATSGALADMRRRGLEHLSYFQVDNPLVHCIDALFLGLHDLSGSEMSSKTIPKAGALEKVGNFVLADGKVQVIEYSDLPESLAQERDAADNLKFNAGSIAIHALRVSFIERLNSGGDLKLPWHRAEKKVPFINAEGEAVKPEKVNAVKLEQFVFDAIPLARNPIIYQTDRAEEFSPVKNAEGNDSPATCRRDQVRRAAKWLGQSGVHIPVKEGEPDCTLEISPLLATTAEQLAGRRVKVDKVAAGQVLMLDEKAPRVG